MYSSFVSEDKQAVVLLSSIRKRSRIKEFTIRKRRINAYMLCMVTDGEGILYIDDIPIRLQPLQLYHLTPGMVIEAAFTSSAAEYVLIHMELVRLSGQGFKWIVKDEADYPELLPSGLLQLQSVKQVEWKMNELYEKYGHNSETIPMRAHLQFQHLVYFIMQELEEQAPLLKSNDHGIELSMAYMRNHLRDKLSLDKLSSIAKLTPTAYCRSFKRVNGVSPLDYLNQLRINDAKEQLRLQRPVKDVASSVGFSSEFYFSRLFKRSTGVPPTVYMKRNELRIGVVSYLDFKDNLISLGVEPVERLSLFQFDDRSKDNYEEQICIHLEKLRQSRPSLIIGDFFHHPFYDRLKQVAPTVLLNYNGDWRVLHKQLSELTNRENEAINTFKYLELKAAKARKRLRAAFNSRDITIMYFEQNKVRIQGAVNHPLSQLAYAELGLHPGDAVPLNKKREDFTAFNMPDLPYSNHYLIHLWDNVNGYPVNEDLQTWARSRSAHYITDWLSMSWTPTGRKRIIDELVHLMDTQH